MRVCVLMVMRLAIVSPQLCHTELIQPLAAPLLAVFACSADDDASEADVPIRTAYVYEKYLYGASVGDVGDAGGYKGKEVGIIKVRDPAVLSDVLSVQSCVELLHLLVTLCPMHAALARALCMLDVDTAVLHLYLHTLSVRSTVSAQLFETVESFLVNLYKFGGSKMVSRAEHFLYSRLTRPAWVFHVTKQGLVEVRMAPEPVASALSLSQVLLAVQSDNQDVPERKVATDVEVALQIVKTRLSAVTSLLLIFEESITARSAQMDVAAPLPLLGLPRLPAHRALPARRNPPQRVRVAMCRVVQCRVVGGSILARSCFSAASRGSCASPVQLRLLTVVRLSMRRRKMERMPR